jgi:MFS family permease
MLMIRTCGKTLGTLVVLAVTQIIGWGTVGFPAVVGRQMVNDLGLSLPTIFSGSSILYVTMGLCGPFLGKWFISYGARVVMIAGTLIAVPGYAFISFAHGSFMYFLGWVVIGVGGSATLTTAAYIMLSEVAGKEAKDAIGGLMLLTGLSSSFFWPITLSLSVYFGWRDACQIYSLVLLFISLPLYIFFLPKLSVSPNTEAKNETIKPLEPVRSKITFLLIVGAIAINSFVTFGFAAIIIELLKVAGLSAEDATTFGSMLGVVQVGARALDMLGGARWDGITTGIFAGAALPISMMFLMFGIHSHIIITIFLLLYGLGSGALAVARATIPLVFYEKETYVKASSRIALPLNIMSALAPPILIATLNGLGPISLLAVTAGCSSTALIFLLVLSKRRPKKSLK